jgi:CheY-like chemotaxis protein
VADIAMPRLDGFQMIRKIKEDEALRRIPIVIVSARDQEEYRRKGFELGVEAYVVKTAFDQTSLLDTIQRLIGDV